jgi:hypothetical protein
MDCPQKKLVIVGSNLQVSPDNAKRYTEFIDSCDIVVRFKVKSCVLLGLKTDIIFFNEVFNANFRKTFCASQDALCRYSADTPKKIRYHVYKSDHAPVTKKIVAEMNRLNEVHGSHFVKNGEFVDRSESDQKNHRTIGYTTIFRYLDMKERGLLDDYDIYIVNFTFRGACEHDWVQEKKDVMQLVEEGKIKFFE